MTTREHGSAIDLDVKSIGDDGSFEGLGAAFNNVDSYRDVIKPGAFKASLDARPADRVRLLFQHDQAKPIGVFTDLHEDADGLVAKGRLILTTTAGREAYELLKAGAVDGLSIGFVTKKSSRGTLEGKSVRFLEEIDLHEISIVTFPSNPRATVSRIKSTGTFDAGDILTEINAARAAIQKGSA